MRTPGEREGRRPEGERQGGVSLVAAVFLITVLAFMGMVFVTMISTGSIISVDTLRSSQAFSLAEGGLEFDARELARNLDWYRSTADPLSMTTYTHDLGAGSFAVRTCLPATKLRRRLLTGGAVIQVYTTDRFPQSGYLQIDDDVAGGGEYVHYTNIAGATFTGVTRGLTIGTTATAASAHGRGTAVYPVSTLTAGLPSDCSAPSSFTVVENGKFPGSGIVVIEDEELSYTGSTVAGGVMTLTGVRRCLGSVGPVSHAAGQPVTPLLIGGESADYEAETVSQGAVGNAVRVTRKNVLR